MATLKREDLPDFLLAVLVAIVLVFAVARTAADPDLWGHVRFGQDILASGSIPRLDPYSFTSDRPWVNHEWLAEAVMASAFNAAGSAGLLALKWITAAATLAILWRTTRRSGVSRPAAAGLLLATAVGVYPLLIAIRPQLFSVLLFSIQLALMNGIARGRPRLFLWMVPLFAVWANVHGGWMVGVGVLVLWSAGTAATGGITWRWAAVGAVLAALGSLSNPYGLGLWRFLWETVGLGRAEIDDWQPLWRAPAYLIPWGLAALLVVFAWRRRGTPAIAALLPAAALGVLALRVIRLEGFFALAAVALSAPFLAGLGPERLPLSRRPTRADLALVCAMCAAGLVGAVVAVAPRAGCITLTNPALTAIWAPEPEAITFLRQNGLHGRLLNWFDYGEMAIWYLAPGLQVSYDGRRETVYSGAVRAGHDRFYAGADGVGYARELKPDYIWLPRRLPVIARLEQNGWVAIFRGARSVVLARQAGPYTQPAPWTGPRCFPGP